MHKVLSDVAEQGYLPGDHHFTISFLTHAENVKISPRLAEQWPHELTIILQHQYSDLEVSEEGFGVTLSFRGVAENLYIPFAAVTGFFDPSVEFGLRFEADEEEETQEGKPTSPLMRPSLVTADTPPQVQASKPASEKQKKKEKIETAPAAEQEGQDDASKVVSIDAFRKKPNG
jgi:hypothetical protein